MSACAQKSQKIMSTYFLYTTFHSWIYHYILQLFNQHEPCCSGLHTHSVTLIKYNTSQVITCCRDWTTVTPGWASCLNTGAITESPSCSCSTSERSAPARSRVADTQGACRSSNESTTIMPPGAQSGGRPCRCAILPDWYADCSHRCPIAVYSTSCVQRRLCRPQDPSEIRWEGVLRRCSSSMESAANRTEVDAFHASFQALLENILLQDCLL